MISASVTFFSAFQLLLVEPSWSLLPWRHWGARLPHAVSFFLRVCRGLRPGRDDFTFGGAPSRGNVGAHGSVVSSLPESKKREGPSQDMGSRRTNRANMTFYNGALICLMSQDRLGTDARPCVTPGSHRRCPASYSHGEILGRPGPGPVPITDTEWQLGFGERWVRLVWLRLQPPAQRHHHREARREAAPAAVGALPV